MSKVYDGIDDRLTRWIGEQPVFFVGTAPLSGDGHVNVSPKGMAGTFTVLDPHRVAYLDYFGSGAETIAHVRENGRIVVMFCAFTGPPKIVRLHGRARIVQKGEDGYGELRAIFPKQREQGARSVVVVDVDRVSDACGWSVPRLDFVADRDVLDLLQQKKPADYYERETARERQGTSIDGLPALR